MSRFPTGLQHWVYDVVLESGRKLVLRIASRENRSALEGALYWYARLRPLGVPLAEIRHSDLRGRHPFLVLERLPGTDLGHVYGSLSPRQRRALAEAMARLQDLAAQLPESKGYGYALRYGARLAPDWRGVLAGSLKRGRRWIERGGGADPAWAERVEERLEACGDDFADVRPRAFLHDITTKNVIVTGGELSGIVDVDSMAFGDPLWTIALTRMSLLTSRRPTDYIDAWCATSSSRTPRERLDLYTALHGLNFLGELGQSFNRTTSEPVDPEHLRHLEATLSTLLE